MWTPSCTAASAVAAWAQTVSTGALPREAAKKAARCSSSHLAVTDALDLAQTR